jgi:uncharacterized RDD family membrane protein YckC
MGKEIEISDKLKDYSNEELYDLYSKVDKDIEYNNSQLLLEEIQRREKEGTIEPKLADRSDRLAACVLDSVIIFIPNLILVFFFYDFDSFWNNIAQRNIFMMLAYTSSFALVYLLLNGYLLYKHGQTIGKRVMDIKIVDMNNKVPSILRSYFLRTFLFTCIGYIPVLRIASIIDPFFIFSKEKRCLHDYLAKTKVVDKYTSSN